ncbi:MAG TPA: hypothetical protein VNJ09_09390 [Chthonomonadales bacterium]|nr:hypothetical protein [Chthonomonadales bacterium]
MRKLFIPLLAALIFCGSAAVGKAAILFDYEVLVDGAGPFIDVDYTKSSGANGKLRVTGLAGVNFDADGLGSDVDIATILAFQTPPSSSFSNFNGLTSAYTFTVRVFDLASSTSGDFTVKGFLHGRFKTSPKQFAIGNTYTVPPNGQMLIIGKNNYFLVFPVYGQDFDAPGPDGGWTFNIHAVPVVPEPGAATMFAGVAVAGTLFALWRMHSSHR